ncbi:hypothetical protein OE88DRAFT_1656305 [Heliocybe sulcata]|uniref:Fungal-type protein kinase domain-containing protein n=1 Tax=Heliocybe sulcata TaxID=5364 RepID=A0A5C3N5P0_9AGAM|nr:hypothetical protein OE88DRAFT_1656305 [Heliocybe sulcata]
MISVNPAAEGGAKGFSIDLEHAVFLQQKRPTSNIREMAGTFYFIAIERQRPRYSREHRAYHDLESFYWSLVYTTLRHTVTSEDPQYCVKALEGEEGFGKMAFITHIRTRLTVAFNPRLSACLKSFGEVVRESSKAESADQRMTHEAAINSLDEELEKPGWRENDKAVTFSLLDVPPEEELEHDRKEHSAVLRLMKKVDSSCTVRQAALKRKAGDEADDGQNEEVKAGESSDSKHCPRRPM